MSLKPRKKGGCYGNVSDNYMLLENAINQVKTSGGCREFADINSSYMLTETKGGRKNTKKGGDLLSMGNDLLQKTTKMVRYFAYRISSHSSFNTKKIAIT